MYTFYLLVHLVTVACVRKNDEEKVYIGMNDQTAFCTMPEKNSAIRALHLMPGSASFPYGLRERMLNMGSIFI